MCVMTHLLSLPLWERGFKKKLYREFGLDTLSKENL